MIPNQTNRIKVQPLFSFRLPRRSYLVLTDPIVRVDVLDLGSRRETVCPLCSGSCVHISLVAEIDNGTFPPGTRA